MSYREPPATAFTTADLCDAHAEGLQLVEPGLRSFGGSLSFSGPIATLEVYEDNSLVRAELESLGNGRVLVIQGGGSLRVALLGGNLASLAVQNGWAGVVVHGAVRDTQELAHAELGILALASCPRRSRKDNQGSRDRLVSFLGVDFRPGDQLYADADGVVVLSAGLTP